MIMMLKNNEMTHFLETYTQFAARGESDKQAIKQLSEQAVKAFNQALEQEDPLKRFEAVSQVVKYMKLLVRHDSTMAEFLLAKKKMTNYALLERLSDPNQVMFTLQDCALLNQRYHALQDGVSAI